MRTPKKKDRDYVTSLETHARAFARKLPQVAKTGPSRGQVRGGRQTELRAGGVPTRRFRVDIDMEPQTRPSLLIHASRGVVLQFVRWELISPQIELLCKHTGSDGTVCNRPLVHGKARGKWSSSQTAGGFCKTLWRRGERPVVQFSWNYGDCGAGHYNKALDSRVVEQLPDRKQQLVHCKAGMLPVCTSSLYSRN